ncbi:MAG: isochorismatase family cysteine hydrolase [Candidatus Caldarchaeum sp.]
MTRFTSPEKQLRELLEQKASKLTPEPVKLNVKKTMLVIIDMQNDFVKPGGAIYLGQDAERIVPAIKRLLEKARGHGMLILFTKSWYEPDDPRFSDHPKASAKLKGCMAGTEGAEIIEELAPQQGELVITKPSYDCWFGTKLEETLKTMGFGSFAHGSVHRNRLLNDYHVIITGVATNVCVEKAVIGFYLRGYGITIPIDCVAAMDELEQFWALHQFKEFYAAKLTLSGLIEFTP